MVATYTYRQGDFGRVVRDVQRQLQLEVDGKFGPKTDAAVRSYQKSTGLTVDGIVGPRTLAAMGLELIAGVDVSAHNPALDWQAARQGGVRFAYCKATEGQTWTDKRVTAHLDGARAAGVKVGVYHFATPSSAPADPELEARHFAATVAQLGKLDLPPVLDLEANPTAMAPGALADWGRRWCTAVAAALGRRPMVYTYTSFLSQLGDAPGLREFPLWIARLNGQNDPGPVSPWQTWDLWQYAIGKVPGASSDTDRNWLPGGEAGLAALCALH
jgi:lysozyme